MVPIVVATIALLRSPSSRHLQPKCLTLKCRVARIRTM